MQRTLGLKYSSDIGAATSYSTAVADRKSATVREGSTCCPSTGMAEFLREYLPDEFMLTAKGANVVRGYWHIRPARLLTLETERKHAGRKYEEVIRLTWPAQSLWENNYVILPVDFDACHQCIEVPVEGSSYQAEIGWLSEEGYFIPILRSNWTDCSRNFDRPFPKD